MTLTLTDVTCDVLGLILTFLDVHALVTLGATCTYLQHLTAAQLKSCSGTLQKVGSGTLAAAVQQHGSYLVKIVCGGAAQPDCTAITSRELRLIATTCPRLHTLHIYTQYSYTLCDGSDMLLVLQHCPQLIHLVAPFKLMYCSRLDAEVSNALHLVAPVQTLRLHGFCSSVFCTQPMFAIKLMQRTALHTLHLSHVDNLNIGVLLHHFVHLRSLVIKWCRTFDQPLLYFYPVRTLRVVKIQHSSTVVRTLNPLLQHLIYTRVNADGNGTLPIEYLAGSHEDAAFVRFVNRWTCTQGCAHVSSPWKHEIRVCAACVQRRPRHMAHLPHLHKFKVYSMESKYFLVQKQSRHAVAAVDAHATQGESESPSTPAVA
jgi:hypothetical protein